MENKPGKIGIGTMLQEISKFYQPTLMGDGKFWKLMVRGHRDYSYGMDGQRASTPDRAVRNVYAYLRDGGLMKHREPEVTSYKREKKPRWL